jgi:hypothetical protein
MSIDNAEMDAMKSDSSLITPFAAWSEWQAEAYLQEYYREVEPDERFLLEFLVEVMREMPPVPVALDFGCGPTVHRLFPLVPRVREIHLAEFLPENRAAVAGWVAARPQAHDWRPFARETLRIEGDVDPSERRVGEREQATRGRITGIVPGDASERDPLGRARRGFYPLVTTHYCADSATDDKGTWRRYMLHIAGLVQPGGQLIASALGGSRGYRVGSRWFPAVAVTARELGGFFEEAGFTEIEIRDRAVPDRAEKGYGSVIFARAVNSNGVP